MEFQMLEAKRKSLFDGRYEGLLQDLLRLGSLPEAEKA